MIHGRFSFLKMMLLHAKSLFRGELPISLHLAKIIEMNNQI